MFSLLEAFLLLSYTRMVYVLSCRGFLVVIVHRDGVCSLLQRLSCCNRTHGWCMFSLVVAFLLSSYTGMVYVLSCGGVLVIIVNRDGVCSLLYRLS